MLHPLPSLLSVILFAHVLADGDPKPPADKIPAAVQKYLREALDAANKVENKEARIRALGQIARAQHAAGDRAGAAKTIGVALEAAEGLEDEAARVRALQAIIIDGTR